MRTWFFSLLILLALPGQLSGQVVRGQLLNGETGLPLEGAMMILQEDSREAAMFLTNAAGRFMIRAPGPGSYTVRADRIGHARSWVLRGSPWRSSLSVRWPFASKASAGDGSTF